MKLKKIKAGALQSTLFMSVVIDILLSAYIVLIQVHKRIDNQTQIIQVTVYNAKDGVNYALLNNITLKQTIPINLYDEDYKSLKNYKDHWEVFETVTSI